MEKQTKILLGLGAVIAAYLILKPKNAVAQTSVANAPTPENPAKDGIFDADFNVNTTNDYLCPDGYERYWSSYDKEGNVVITNGVMLNRNLCKVKGGEMSYSDIEAVKNPNYDRLIIKKPLTPKDCSEAKSNLELFRLAYNSVNPQTRRSGGAYRGEFADTPWFLIPDYAKTPTLDLWVYGGKEITLTPEQIAEEDLRKQKYNIEKERLKAEYYAQQDRKSKAKLYAEDTIKAIGLTDCYNEWIAEQLKLEQERNRMEAMYPRAAFQ
jgi:hypothetical protein